MRDMHERISAINTIAVQMARAATEGTGVEITEDKISRMTVLAESMLPDDFIDNVHTAAGAAAVAEVISEAAKILEKEEDGLNTNKHGGAVMTKLFDELKRKEPDFVDDVNALGDKISAGQGEIAGTEVRMMHIEKDPIGAIAVVFEKLSALSEDILKIASATDALADEVAKITGSADPSADAKVQDEQAKDEKVRTDLLASAEATGTDVMKGDPSGQKSKPTNPEMAGAGGVSANPITAVGDVIARANKAQANVKAILQTLKKK